MDWQAELKAAIRDPFELCRRLDLPESVAQEAVESSGQFGLFAPLPFVQRIAKAKRDDPLLLQLLPVADELVEKPGFDRDPVGDQAAYLAPGVIQKYAGRALLITTGALRHSLRYCFRRHFPYAAAPKGLRTGGRRCKRLPRIGTLKKLSSAEVIRLC